MECSVKERFVVLVAVVVVAAAAAVEEQKNVRWVMALGRKIRGSLGHCHKRRPYCHHGHH